MNNLELFATEIFQILRSYDYTVVMYNDDQDITYEPEEARRFFAKPKNILLAIEDDNDNSTLKVCLSASCDLASMQHFLDTLRNTSTKYNMLYNVEHFGREIEPKEFASKSAFKEGKNYMIELTEQMYGTSRSSYLRLESAKMIVRHSKKIVGEDVGARSRNIGSIFVENANGERFLFPTNSLMAGRAMTQHVNQGGGWADQIGQQIQRMATDFQDLGQCASFVQNNNDVLAEGAGEIFERCKASRKSMRKVFERLFRESTYAGEAQRITEAGEPPLVEGPVLENLRETLRVDGKELPESVYEAVARAMRDGEGERSITEDNMTTAVTQTRDHDRSDGEMIGILDGREVNAKAWADLRQGHIELVKPVHIPQERPANWFTSVNATPKMTAIDKALWKLDFIVPLIKDSSLVSVLAWIDSEMERQKKSRVLSPEAQQLRNKMFIVVGAVLRAAKVDIDLKEGLGARGVRAIREFESWFDGFMPERVLFEDIGVNPAQVEDIEDSEEGEDEKVEEGVRDVDTEDFGDPDAFSPRDVEPHRDYDMDGESADMRDDDDFHRDDEDLDEGDLIEDTELTQEDIVLPKRTQGEDLAADVQSKDPEALAIARAMPSMRVAEDMKRMRKLAGLNEEANVSADIALLLVKTLNAASIPAEMSNNGSYFVVQGGKIEEISKQIDQALAKMQVVAGPDNGGADRIIFKTNGRLYTAKLQQAVGYVGVQIAPVWG